MIFQSSLSVLCPGEHLATQPLDSLSKRKVKDELQGAVWARQGGTTINTWLHLLARQTISPTREANHCRKQNVKKEEPVAVSVVSELFSHFFLYYIITEERPAATPDCSFVLTMGPTWKGSAAPQALLSALLLTCHCQQCECV